MGVLVSQAAGRVGEDDLGSPVVRTRSSREIGVYFVCTLNNVSARESVAAAAAIVVFFSFLALLMPLHLFSPFFELLLQHGACSDRMRSLKPREWSYE